MHKPVPQVIGATLQTTQIHSPCLRRSIAEIEIRLTKLEKDRQRYQNLVKRNATPIQLEQKPEYAATHKKLEAVKRQRKLPCRVWTKCHTRRENTEAAIQRATALLEMARLNSLLHRSSGSLVRKLGLRTLKKDIITAGQTITYILPDTQKWINSQPQGNPDWESAPWDKK